MNKAASWKVAFFMPSAFSCAFHGNAVVHNSLNQLFDLLLEPTWN